VVFLRGRGGVRVRSAENDLSQGPTSISSLCFSYLRTLGAPEFQGQKGYGTQYESYGLAIAFVRVSLL
jgi:hypothetical protein